MFAVSQPIANNRRHSSRFFGNRLSSMREQCGERRRTIHRRRTWTKGSGARTARLIIAWYKISVGPSLTVTFARMSRSCRFWTSTKLRVFSSAPITRKSLCFDFGRTDRLYVFYEFDSCPKILESVRALQLKELGTAAARERHCPAILQSSVPRQYLAVGAALPLSVSC